MAQTAEILAYLASIGGFFTFLWKLWKKLKHMANGQTCLLRSDITEMYYKHAGSVEPALREYERKNLDDLYEGYKALGGNHYIDDIYEDMRRWKVIS